MTIGKGKDKITNIPCHTKSTKTLQTCPGKLVYMVELCKRHKVSKRKKPQSTTTKQKQK